MFYSLKKGQVMFLKEIEGERGLKFPVSPMLIVDFVQPSEHFCTQE